MCKSLGAHRLGEVVLAGLGPGLCHSATSTKINTAAVSDAIWDRIQQYPEQRIILFVINYVIQMFGLLLKKKRETEKITNPDHSSRSLYLVLNTKN